jgi:hypothetical protein
MTKMHSLAKLCGGGEWFSVYLIRGSGYAPSPEAGIAGVAQAKLQISFRLSDLIANGLAIMSRLGNGCDIDLELYLETEVLKLTVVMLCAIDYRYKYSINDSMGAPRCGQRPQSALLSLLRSSSFLNPRSPLLEAFIRIQTPFPDLSHHA